MVVRAPGSTIIVISDAAPASHDLLTIEEACAIARCSHRTLSDARRNGSLRMSGTQRTRTVRRSDLETWIEARATRPMTGANDNDIARRMRRIAG